MTLNELIQKLREIRAQVPAEVDPPVAALGSGGEGYYPVDTAFALDIVSEVCEDLSNRSQPALDFSADSAFVRAYKFGDDRDELFADDDYAVVFAVDADF